MIPLAKPYIDDADIKEVELVLKSGKLSFGPVVPEFESSFANLIGTKYAISVNSGTSGLHLAVKSLGIGKGDEVITSPFSFVASANCALFEGAKPVFVDVDEDTFNMNPDLIEEKITTKTKAIIPVHIFGQSCDMDKIISIAKKYNLKIIEDACESINATYKGKTLGSLGDVAVFAFYPNKQMTTGEGGMIVTNNKKSSDLCKSMRNQGRGDDMQWLVHTRLGYNYRMSDIHAALGFSQLKKIDFLISERQKIVNLYLKLLSDVKQVTLPIIAKGNTHTWFVFPIRVEKQFRDKLIDFLGENNIQSKAYFSPCIHLQPFYKEKYGYKEGDFPVAEKLSKTTLILPLYVGMNKENILLIRNTIKDFFENKE